MCDSCSRRKEPCTSCGRLSVVTARPSEGPLCSSCYDRSLRLKGVCPTCGQLRRLVLDDGGQPCVCTDCAGLAASHVCGVCGVEDRLIEKGLCERCLLVRRLDALLRAPDGPIPPALEPLYETLRSVERPHSVVGWLKRSDGARLLGELASGVRPISHEGLDAVLPSKPAEFLRDLLVSCGVLPGRDPYLARFERWATEFVAGVTDWDHRQLLQTFSTWRLLPHLRNLAERNRSTQGSLNSAKMALGQAAKFLAWLSEHGSTLQDCGQAELDCWLADGPSSRYALCSFVAWVKARGLLVRVRFPQRQGQKAMGSLDGDERWELIGRLLYQDTSELVDRVAGSLVLLYAQPLARIARLGVEDISDLSSSLMVRLGEQPVALPPALAGLVRQLLADRKGQAAIEVPGQSAWLFPGASPGKPISVGRLRKRLGLIGVEVRKCRNAAKLQLASDLPPSVLADLLGFHISTVAGWFQLAGGDWVGYAAARMGQREQVGNAGAPRA
jgi:hypothetical protein